MANPRISPHLRYFPEDAGNVLGETWQGKRWLKEIDPTLASQMVRIGHQDFYVFEPAKLTDGSVVMPVRLFTRSSGPASQAQQKLWAEVWQLQPVSTDEGHRGYVVHEYDSIEVPIHSFLLSMPQMVQTFASDNLPDPRDIIGVSSCILSILRLSGFLI
jgi:hypothetical protein